MVVSLCSGRLNLFVLLFVSLSLLPPTKSEPTDIDETGADVWGDIQGTKAQSLSSCTLALFWKTILVASKEA